MVPPLFIVKWYMPDEEYKPVEDVLVIERPDIMLVCQKEEIPVRPTLLFELMGYFWDKREEDSLYSKTHHEIDDVELDMLRLVLKFIRNGEVELRQNEYVRFAEAVHVLRPHPTYKLLRKPWGGYVVMSLAQSEYTEHLKGLEPSKGETWVHKFSYIHYIVASLYCGVLKKKIEDAKTGRKPVILNDILISDYNAIRDLIYGRDVQINISNFLAFCKLLERYEVTYVGVESDAPELPHLTQDQLNIIVLGEAGRSGVSIIHVEETEILDEQERSVEEETSNTQQESAPSISPSSLPGPSSLPETLSVASTLIYRTFHDIGMPSEATQYSSVGSSQTSSISATSSRAPSPRFPVPEPDPCTSSRSSSFSSEEPPSKRSVKSKLLTVNVTPLSPQLRCKPPTTTTYWELGEMETDMKLYERSSSPQRDPESRRSTEQSSSKSGKTYYLAETSEATSTFDVVSSDVFSSGEEIQGSGSAAAASESVPEPQSSSGHSGARIRKPHGPYKNTTKICQRIDSFETSVSSSPKKQPDLISSAGEHDESHSVRQRSSVPSSQFVQQVQHPTQQFQYGDHQFQREAQHQHGAQYQNGPQYQHWAQYQRWEQYQLGNISYLLQGTQLHSHHKLLQSLQGYVDHRALPVGPVDLSRPLQPVDLSRDSLRGSEQPSRVEPQFMPQNKPIFVTEDTPRNTLEDDPPQPPESDD